MQLSFLRAIVLLAGIYFAAPVLGQSVGSPDESPPLSMPAESQVAVPEEPSVAPMAPPMPTESKHRVSTDLTKRVETLTAQKQFVKAIELINQTLATDNGNAELYRLRATVHCRAANMKLCLEDASKAVETDPEYPPAYLFRGLVRIDIGQAKQAIGDCEITIKLWHARPLGYNCRGLANRALREFSRAIADFDEALGKDERFAIAHYNKGVTYALQDRPQEASASFSSSIAINPKHDDSFARRGKARIGMGDVGGARADFAQALSLNGRNTTAAVGMQALQVGKAFDVLSRKK